MKKKFFVVITEENKKKIFKHCLYGKTRNDSAPRRIEYIYIYIMYISIMMHNFRKTDIIVRFVKIEF